jgi:hypothetical protein
MTGSILEAEVGILDFLPKSGGPTQGSRIRSQFQNFFMAVSIKTHSNVTDRPIFPRNTRELEFSKIYHCAHPDSDDQNTMDSGVDHQMQAGISQIGTTASQIRAHRSQAHVT